jgi:hypothetical protein
MTKNVSGRRDDLVACLRRAGELQVSGDNQEELDSYFDTRQFRFHGPDGCETDYAGLANYFKAIRAVASGRPGTEWPTRGLGSGEHFPVGRPGAAHRGVGTDGLQKCSPGGSARSLCCGFVAQRPTGCLNAWRTREASSLAKASLTGACPMIRRK